MLCFRSQYEKGLSGRKGEQLYQTMLTGQIRGGLRMIDPSVFKKTVISEFDKSKGRKERLTRVGVNREQEER